MRLENYQREILTSSVRLNIHQHIYEHAPVNTHALIREKNDKKAYMNG